MDITVTNQVNKGGAVSRSALYSMAQKHAPRAIEVLQELMNSKYQPSVRMGAAKTLLGKAIPDLKAMEITGEGINPVKVLVLSPELVEKYYPQGLKLDGVSSNTEDNSKG